MRSSPFQNIGNGISGTRNSKGNISLAVSLAFKPEDFSVICHGDALL